MRPQDVTGRLQRLPRAAVQHLCGIRIVPVVELQAEGIVTVSVAFLPPEGVVHANVLTPLSDAFAVVPSYATTGTAPVTPLQSRSRSTATGNGTGSTVGHGRDYRVRRRIRGFTTSVKRQWA